MYNLVQPTQTHCVTCGTSLKASISKQCPNPAVISEYLHDNTDFDGHIEDGSKVCYVCYKAHLVILKRGANEASKDCDLQQVITTLSVNSSIEATSIQGAIDISVNRVAIEVGKQLLIGNAMLLPSIQDLLLEYIQTTIRVSNLEAEPVAGLATSRWLLSNLTATLKNHIQSVCTVRKYGTLIYRSNVTIHAKTNHKSAQKKI